MTSKNSFFKSLSTKSISTRNLVSVHISSCNSEKMYKVGNNPKAVIFTQKFNNGSKETLKYIFSGSLLGENPVQLNLTAWLQGSQKSFQIGIFPSGSICNQKSWVKPGKMEATDDFSNTDVTVRFEGY